MASAIARDEPVASSNDTVFELARRFRFQWEEAQAAYVLLYPEGMVKLGQSAGEILKRVNGTAAVSEIVADLERAFPGADLRQDVIDFLEHALDKGWIKAR
jgi:pyrroloquinoline quinone biosynthesis protein D